MKAAGWYTDCAPEFNEKSEKLNTWKNPGAFIRYEKHKNSTSVDYMATLQIPFARQRRYLLNHLDIRFELHRVSDAFALMSTEKKYKIVVEDLKMYVRKIELSNDLAAAIEKQLQTKHANYPVRRLELKVMHIGSGRKTTPTNTVWQGPIPRRVILCTLPNINYFGDVKKNPFLFEPNKIIRINLFVDNKCIPYSGPLDMKFYNIDEDGTSLISRAYVQLHTSMGLRDNPNNSNSIDMHRFTRDACYFVFDLTSDNTDDTNHWELIRTGSVSINMEFEEGIGNDGLRVIILGEFDNLITIDRLRQINMNYKA